MLTDYFALTPFKLPIRPGARDDWAVKTALEEMEIDRSTAKIKP